MDDRFNFNDFLFLALIGCLFYTTSFYWLLYKQISKGNIKSNAKNRTPYFGICSLYSSMITTALMTNLEQKLLQYENKNFAKCCSR